MQQYPQGPAVILSPALRQQLRQFGLYCNQGVRIERNLKYNAPVTLLDHCQLMHMSIDAYSYVGNNCNLVLSSVGRYCSIAEGVEGGFGLHDIHCATTSCAVTSVPVFTAFSGPVKRLSRIERERGECYTSFTMGNDVWVGEHACIVGDVTIGDGAVIGAGSVITHDVPPYAIVSGVGGGHNSERIITGYRFTDEQISDLLELQWWQYDLPKYIAAGHKIPLENITDFIEFMRAMGPDVLTKIQDNWRLLITQTENQAQLAAVSKDYEIGPNIPEAQRRNPAYAG